MKRIYQFINVPLVVLRGQRGGSIIAAVFLIVVIGFLGAIVVSLVSTQSFQSVGELKSTEALYIADGGIEYALETGTFPNYSYPPWSTRAGATVADPCPSASAIVLGNGNFCVDPPTVLTANISAADPTIQVVPTPSFNGFPNQGRIIIGSELIDYTGKTANSFTGATRGAGLPVTTATNHFTNDAVYSVTYLSATLPANPAACPSVNTTTGFLAQGIVKIDSEYIYYSDISSGTNFASCIRGFRGTSVAAHPVTGLSVPSVYQYAITSTGSVSPLVGGKAQRVVRVTVGP